MNQETPFWRRARQLKSPTSAHFDNAAWQEAFSVTHEPSESDQALFNAATWIANQSAALRNHFFVPGLAGLGGRLSIILAIAAINREFKTVTQLNRAAISDPKQESVVALDHLSQQLIPGALPGHQATATSYIETALDAAESWLFDAYRMNPETTATPADIAPIAVRAIQRYSMQYTQNHLWNQALWEGWRLHDRDGALIWMPGDRPRATLIEAWRVRQQSNFMKYVWIDMSVWAALAPADRRARAYRTVLEVRNGKHRHFRVGRPPCLSKIMPGALVEKAGFEGSYLLQFVDEPFPNDSRLTCSLLSRAWHVINDLASLLAKSIPDPVSLTERQARSLALIVGRSELSDVLCRALKEEPSSVDAIIDFLSFKIRMPGEKGHRGIWASPLIPIPGEDRFALALAALSTSNALRKAEAWLEKGGLDDTLARGARGESFEQDLRQKVRSRLAGNEALSDARCAENAVKKDATFDEQVDLLFQIGSLLFVGEVKFHLSPVDPHERFNHMKKLQSASEQARRKAQLLGTRPDVIAKALGITEERAKQLHLIPLIVDNQGFGVSLDVDGCRVTDSSFLLVCLGSGRLVTSAVMAPGTGRQVQNSITLYTNQADAEQKLESILGDPPTLAEIKRRIVWEQSRLPTSSEAFLTVEFPTLGDLVADQRAQAEALKAILVDD